MCNMNIKTLTLKDLNLFDCKTVKNPLVELLKRFRSNSYKMSTILYDYFKMRSGHILNCVRNVNGYVKV